MSETVKLWIPYEKRSAYEFSDEPALACYLGKIFYFYYIRAGGRYREDLFGMNWDRWDKREFEYPFRSKTAFHPSFESCRNEVEHRRKQGSKWIILEMPAVVVAGKDNALIITEISTTPLKDFCKIKYRKKTLISIAECFTPKKENSIIRFLTEKDTIKPAELPFKSQKSKVLGPTEYMKWIALPEKRDFDSVFDIVKAFNRRLQKD